MIRKLLKGLCLLIFSYLMVSLAPPSQAQGGNPTLIIEGATDTSTFPDIKVVVSVVNTGRAPIQGLALKDFEVLEDKQPLAAPTVDTETPSEQPIAVALVLDLSGSAPLENVKEAAKQFLTSLRPQDRAALIGFNTQLNMDSFDPFKESDFTDNKDLLISIIDNFDTVGDSAVYEAILKGALITTREQTTRRAVLVMSDGKDTKSRPEVATADAPEKAARDGKIPIFTVGISDPKFPANLDYLAALASKTGGRYQLASSPDDLAPLFEGVSQQLRQQYALTIKVNLPPDGKEHTLTFRANTPEGQATLDKLISYPAPPTIPKINSLQQEVNRSLEPVRSELKGVVLLAPAISALNPIIKVEYQLDGQLIQTVNTQKSAATARYHAWEWLWDTSQVAEGSHALTIIAYDDSNNVSPPFESQIQISRVSSGLETETPTPAPASPTAATVAATATVAAAVPSTVAGISSQLWLVIAGTGTLIIVLLILAIGLFFWNRRKTAVAEIYQNIPPDNAWGNSNTNNPTGGVGTDWPPIQHEREPTSVSQRSNLTPAPHWQTAVDQPTTLGDYTNLSDNDKTEILMQTNRLPTTGLLLVQESVGKLAAGKTFPLAERINTIGRSENNHIMLDDNSVSRQHAKIVLEGVVFKVEDLGSSNKVKVNGEKVESQYLKENDRLEFGRIKLIFIILSREEEKK